MIRLLIMLFILTNVQFAWSAGVKGEFKASVDSYPTHVGGPTSDLTPYISFDLSGKHRLNRRLRFNWQAIGITNAASKAAPENFYGDIHEAYFEHKMKSWFKWRAGFNTFNWAIVDIISPSDVVNTTAMFHPLRATKQGAPSLEGSFGSNKISLDLLYIPIQRAPQLPSEDSRWLPRSYLLDIRAENTRFIIPKLLEYQWDKPVELDHALQNNAGFKLHSNLGSVDLQLTYFRGAAPSASAVPTELHFDVGSTSDELIARSPIHLTSYSYLVETTAAGFVWALDNWIFRGESAYRHTITKSAFIQAWMWSNILAAETNVDIGSSTATLLTQIYYTKNPAPTDNLISSAYRLFDQTLLTGARWSYSDDLTLLVSALYEATDKGLFWMAGFENKLSDVLRWNVSWRDFSAREEGLIKTFERNDHATLEMVYYF